MPEVITGISMLLLFVFMEQLIGWPTARGFTTITIAHITFSLSYVAVVVQSRLASMDRSVEEAAMDLGSKPLQVLFDVTLPIIAPAIISGWLLAFTLSLDDVVITSFTNGPGSTTLPIYIWGKVQARRDARHQRARHHHRCRRRHRRRHRRLPHVPRREEARARRPDGDRGEQISFQSSCWNRDCEAHRGDDDA